jgi:hypothetical protein
MRIRALGLSKIEVVGLLIRTYLALAQQAAQPVKGEVGIVEYKYLKKRPGFDSRPASATRVLNRKKIASVFTTSLSLQRTTLLQDICILESLLLAPFKCSLYHDSSKIIDLD